MKTRHQLLLALSATAAAVLAACGGGGNGSAATSSVGGGAAQAQAVAVQTYITDNLTIDYSKVWVSIKKITALDGAGTEVTLLDATAAPAVVNLSSLAAVGQFMSTVTIPAGIYTEVRVTLDNSVQLVSLDGSTTTNAKFNATGADFVWKVRNVSLDASTSGQIVLDFNLAKFSYDATTGLVTPSVELPKPSDAFNKFVSQKAEVHGTVTAIDATAGTVTIDDARLGKGVVVTLAKDAVLSSEVDGKTLTLADLKLGDRIEIKGTVTPGATTADPVTVLATVIHVEPAGSPAAPASRVRGEGKVTAVTGTLVTVSVSGANFLPASDSVVVDIGAAKFAHGQASDVVVGVTIEFRGTVSGTGAAAQVAAAVVDVAGAPSKVEHDKHPMDMLADLQGTLAALNSDGSFTLTVTAQGAHGKGAGTYTVDPSSAVYVEGKVSCLVAGAQVEVVGALTNLALTAKLIGVEGCGGQKRSAPPASSASAPI